MSSVYLSVNGAPAREGRLHVPNSGAWLFTCELESDVDVTSPASVVIGDATLVGRVLPEFSGTHALARHLVIAGGNGKWGVALPPKDYRNDAGVKGLTIATDAARETGETLGNFTPLAATVGPHFARQFGPASRTLEFAAQGANWWVDYSGLTQVGQRATRVAAAEDYEVLGFAPHTGVAELAIESVLRVGVASTLNSKHLDVPRVIQSFDLIVKQDSVRMLATCGTAGSSTQMLEKLFASVVQRATDSKLHGIYRYRVVSMGVDRRVNLQVVDQAAGLPNLLPVEQAHVPGGVAIFKAGAVVHVEFAEGNPSRPRITSAQGPQGPNAVPEVLYLGGEENAQEIACKGDTVDIPLPPAIFSGTIGGVPASGVLTFPVMRATGAIMTGTNRVKGGRG